MLDIVQIMELLPHRYPFLLVDKVIELDQGKRIVAIKNVTINEPFFQGHFPNFPVMPGVLIVEAMAQVAAIMAYLLADKDSGDKVSYFMAIDKCRFRKPVKPGDTLRIEIDTIYHKRGIWSVSGKAYVDDTLVTEAELKATLADK
jgi:3-hydroxyacyl-[acyl-carrier-protein] dehydratase